MSRDPVKIYMRVQDQIEVQVGTARSMADVPVLLRAIAGRWERGLRPDEDEEPSVGNPETPALILTLLCLWLAAWLGATLAVFAAIPDVLF